MAAIPIEMNLEMKSKAHKAHNSLSEKGIENLRVQSKFLYKDWPMDGKLEIFDNNIDYTSQIIKEVECFEVFYLKINPYYF